MTVRVCIALLALGACLREPPRPTLEDGDGGAVDASAIDSSATASDATPIDAIPPDAADVGPGQAFPPTSVTPNITGGWAGDINFDGIDDVVLMSDTGQAATTGVYVLFGRSGTRLTNYHQFLGTGDYVPLAVLGSQLDGTGGLDLMVYAVDFGMPAVNDSDSQLRAHLLGTTEFADPPLVNNVGSLSWQAPFNPGEPLDMFTGRLEESEEPSFFVVHEKGGFRLTWSTWNSADFTLAMPQVFTTDKTTGGASVPNGSNGAVDDLVVWTDTSGDVKWMVNDGSGQLSEVTANGQTRGPHFGALYDMDGTPPLDFIGVIFTELQAWPVDNNSKTTSARYNGETFIDGVGSTTDLLVFDSDVADARPEIIISADSCSAASNNACLFMIPNAFINGSNGQLNGAATGIARALPAGFQPRLMVRGDFDDDDIPELMVFSANGDRTCVRVTNAAFSSCD